MSEKKPRVGQALFKRHFPNATIERRRTNGGRGYYLIRAERGAFMPVADGKTPGEAWRNACYRKGLAEKPEAKP